MTGTGSDRRAWYALLPRFSHVRADFLEAFHEREDLLRRELVGDVDVAALKAGRAGRAESAGRAGTAAAVDPAARTASGARPTVANRGSSADPDDDGDLPYSFY